MGPTQKSVHRICAFLICEYHYWKPPNQEFTILPAMFHSTFISVSTIEGLEPHQYSQKEWRGKKNLSTFKFRKRIMKNASKSSFSFLFLPYILKSVLMSRTNLVSTHSREVRWERACQSFTCLPISLVFCLVFFIFIFIYLTINFII